MPRENCEPVSVMGGGTCYDVKKCSGCFWGDSIPCCKGNGIKFGNSVVFGQINRKRLKFDRITLDPSFCIKCAYRSIGAKYLICTCDLFSALHFLCNFGANFRPWRR